MNTLVSISVIGFFASFSRVEIAKTKKTNTNKNKKEHHHVSGIVK